MTKRIYLFDNLKALLIACVVIGHLADTYIEASYFKGMYVFVYAFHMPLFVFISGFFHKNEDIKRKVVVYLIIGYLFKIFDYVVALFTDGKSKFQLFTEDGAPWYCFVLAGYIGLTYFFKKTDLRLLMAGSIIVGCFSGYYDFLGDFLVLSRFLVFYPFYLLGVTFSRLDRKKLKQNIEKLQASLLIKYLAGAIIILWVYWCFGETEITYAYRKLFTGRNSYTGQFAELGFLFRLLCYALAILLGAALILITSDKKTPYISKLGARTMQIYFWHWLLMPVLKKYLPLSDMCKNLKGQMLYILLFIPIVVIFALPIFSYPIKWITKFRHEEIVDDEIANLFKE